MTPLVISILCLAMVGTSFLSGIFGMAGGMILVGVLLAHHAGAGSDDAARRHADWRRTAGADCCGGGTCAGARSAPMCSAASLRCCCGRSRATCRARRSRCCCSDSRRSWSGWRRRDYRPNPESLRQGSIYGVACMTLILLTGVAGPLIDQFFLGGKLDRREIVATKAICQIFGHGAKLIYFGSLIDQAASVDPDRRGACDRQLDDRHDARQAGARGHERPAVPPLGQRHHHGDRRILCGPRHGAGRADREIAERPAGLTWPRNRQPHSATSL